MTDEPMEYTMGGPRDNVKLYVFRAVSGRRMAVLRGEDGQRVELELADVPRLIQTLNWAMEDVRKADDEAARERAAKREKP